MAMLGLNLIRNILSLPSGIACFSINTLAADNDIYGFDNLKLTTPSISPHDEVGHSFQVAPFLCRGGRSAQDGSV
jgi:hypothetical protein